MHIIIFFLVVEHSTLCQNCQKKDLSAFGLTFDQSWHPTVCSTARKTLQCALSTTELLNHSIHSILMNSKYVYQYSYCHIANNYVIIIQTNFSFFFLMSYMTFDTIYLVQELIKIELKSLNVWATQIDCILVNKHIFTEYLILNKLQQSIKVAKWYAQ